ncbi:secretin N-terminal domain-containing protein [Thiopseudomonas alkaliphila]|uniref:secretin N-terminal domain-containing protein n=1 Tax=Thiopseudomonas alkaliphila TaxID=1697053 RepID=UPI00069E31D7|nr:secretin N-terminal domain-containing protein [Thiopseudomonas alkaliphila]
MSGLLLGSLLSSASFAATELIQVHYRSADKLQPTLQSILGDQGRIVSHGNQLVINASAPQIEEIRQLVQQLDTEPQMLLISIDRTGMAHSEQDSINLGGSFSVDGHQVILGPSGQREITHNRHHSQQQGIEQVRTLEGSAVLISQQQQHPITHYQHLPNGTLHRYSGYQQSGSQLQLRVQLQGQRALISIDDQQIQPATNHAPRQTQQLSSQITTELGQWIDLGSLSSVSQESNRGLTTRQQAHRQQTSGIKIKVERLN